MRKTPKGTKRIKDIINLDMMVITALAVVLIYASFNIVDTLWDRYQSKKTYAAVQSVYHDKAGNYKQDVSNKQGTQITVVSNVPDTFDSLDVKLEHDLEQLELDYIIQNKFNELLDQNEDIVGWIKIEDTVIDYPVVQAKDNDYYLRRDYLGNHRNSGSIFMDFRNQIDKSNRNIILYGHYMRDGTMFGDLLQYEDEVFLYEHPLIQFDTLYENATWEIFAVYKTSTDFYYIRTDFESEDQYHAFLHELQAASMHELDVDVTVDDTILTLSTCANYGSDLRFVVQAKLVETSLK